MSRATAAIRPQSWNGSIDDDFRPAPRWIANGVEQFLGGLAAVGFRERGDAVGTVDTDGEGAVGIGVPRALHDPPTILVVTVVQRVLLIDQHQVVGAQPPEFHGSDRNALDADITHGNAP
jgi:hypothetical protein